MSSSSPIVERTQYKTETTVADDPGGGGTSSSSSGDFCICSLCDYNFTTYGPHSSCRNSGTSDDSEVLRVFLADKNERSLELELCPSCKDQLDQLLETGRQLSLLVDLITTLLLQNSRFTLIHSKLSIISNLFSDPNLQHYFTRSQFELLDSLSKGSRTNSLKPIIPVVYGADIDREIDALETQFHLDRIKQSSEEQEGEGQSEEEHDNERERGTLDPSLCSSLPSLVSMDSCSKDLLGNNIMNVNISALESIGGGSNGFEENSKVKTSKQPSKNLGTSITNLIANTTNDELDVCFSNRIEKMKQSKSKTDDSQGSSGTTTKNSEKMFKLPSVQPKLAASLRILESFASKIDVVDGPQPKRANGEKIIKKRFACNLCPKTLGTKRDLDVHIGSHLKVSKFVCDICGMAYRHKSGMKTHIALHQGDAKYKCDECNKYFTQKSGLERHQEAIHSTARNYKCTECSRTFRYHSSFNLHKQSHKETPDKKFRCDSPSCTQSFFTSYHLKRHLKIHTGDKPFKCSKCGKGFSEKYNLDSHLKTHGQETM